MAKSKGFYVDLVTRYGSGRERWRVAYKRLRGCWGSFDRDTRTIWIHPDQEPAHMVDSVIHEITHVTTGVGSDAAAEEVIEWIAANSTAALLKMGLLKVEDDD